LLLVVSVLFNVQQLLGWALQRLPQMQPLAAAGWDHQQLAAVAGEVHSLGCCCFWECRWYGALDDAQQMLGWVLQRMPFVGLTFGSLDPAANYTVHTA
jgi:hypothetical protein